MSTSLRTLEPSLVNPPVEPRDQRSFLHSLPPTILGKLTPFLTVRPLRQGKVLQTAGEPVAEVCFPLSAVLSLQETFEDGTEIWIAMVGRDGAIGLDAALNPDAVNERAVVQFSGDAAFVPAKHFASLAAESPPLRAMIAKHHRALLAQMQRTAACNVRHSAEQRLCRVLLQGSDLARSNQLSVTQEALSAHVGVRRTTVTLIAQSLQAAGIIQYTRGRIIIRDVDRLRAAACECYGYIEKVRRRLIAA